MSTPQDPAQPITAASVRDMGSHALWEARWRIADALEAAQPDDATKPDVPAPAPLSDEEVALIEADMERIGQWPDQVVARLVYTLRHWKQRAEEAEQSLERSRFLAETYHAQLADIRSRLGGSPDSKLDGDDGIVQREMDRLKDDHAHACETVARMHAAAMGEVAGPKKGVIEDVAQLREENERWKGIVQDCCRALSVPDDGGRRYDEMPGEIKNLRRELTNSRARVAQLESPNGARVVALGGEMLTGAEIYKRCLEEAKVRHKLEARVAQLEEEKAELVENPRDEYHSMAELYEYRLLYNAHAANALASEGRAVKSWKHSDGEPCFGGGWFIVVMDLSTGQVSNHYEASDWDLFSVPEVDLAPEWDGHTPQVAADRLRAALAAQGEG